jgi:steroid delta-isomerase-like uncharacterized protein
MTAEATIRKQEQALNAHDARAFGAGYAEDAVVYDPFYTEPLKGRAAIEKDISEFMTAFPNLSARIDSVLTNGETLAYEGSTTGTHDGPLQGPAGLVPPTNRPIELKIAGFARMDSQDRIVEERRYFDVAGLLAQLGLMQ